MIRALLLCLLIALPAWAQQAPVGTTYWPLNNWCDFRTYAITGYMHPDTMALDVWSRTYMPGNDLRHTFVPIHGAQIPTVAFVVTPVGVPAPPNWYDLHDNNLAQSVWSADGKSGYIGESGTFGATWAPGSTILLPPEPEVPLDATQYTTAITGTTNVTVFAPNTNAVTASTLAWKFRNLGPGPSPNGVYWWPQYPNQIRTALEERPDTNKQSPSYDIIYNYLLVAGIGPVDVWWGTRQADNTVTNGYEWQVIGCGTN